LNSKINEFYLELGVPTKNVIVMLLIVLAEAALRWNFAFWSYFVVIFRVGVDVLYRRAIRTSGILPVKSFSRPTGTLDETDKHFSYKLLLYFAFFVKWITSLTYFRNAKSLLKSCLPCIVRKRQRRSQLSHLIGYIKGHLKLWVCLTLKSNRPKERAKILDDFDHNTLC
jgi:hypothetical protein